MKAVALAAVQLRCPALERSRAFFIDTLGLSETAANAEAVYLRCTGDDAHHTLVLRAAERPGVEAIEILDLRAGDGGSLPGLTALAGHCMNVVRTLEPAPELPGARAVLNQPSPLRGVGIEPRRLSHLGLVAEDVATESEWWRATHGYAPREVVEDEQGMLLSTLA